MQMIPSQFIHNDNVGILWISYADIERCGLSKKEWTSETYFQRNQVDSCSFCFGNIIAR